MLIAQEGMPKCLFFFGTSTIDLNSNVNIGGGECGGIAAIDQLMKGDNSTTTRRDVSGRIDQDTQPHISGNIGNRGNHRAHSVGRCTGGCHLGRCDSIGGSNPTYSGQGQ